MPWTEKQKGFFGARCGEGDEEACDLVKHESAEERDCVMCDTGYHDRCSGGSCSCYSADPGRHPRAESAAPRMGRVFREVVVTPGDIQAQAQAQAKSAKELTKFHTTPIGKMYKPGFEKTPEGDVVAMSKNPAEVPNLALTPDTGQLVPATADGRRFEYKPGSDTMKAKPKF